MANCKEYNLWYKRNGFKNSSQINEILEVPFLPSTVFKHIDLKSVSNKVKKFNQMQPAYYHLEYCCKSIASI